MTVWYPPAGRTNGKMWRLRRDALAHSIREVRAVAVMCSDENRRDLTEQDWRQWIEKVAPEALAEHQEKGKIILQNGSVFEFVAVRKKEREPEPAEFEPPLWWD